MRTAAAATDRGGGSLIENFFNYLLAFALDCLKKERETERARDSVDSIM